MMREDWICFKIDDVIRQYGIFKDGDWVESKDQDPNGDVRLIQLADIGDGFFVDKSNRYLTSDKAKELNCTYLNEGDILLARMPQPLGRATIFPFRGKNKFVTVVDVAIIRTANNYIDNKFLLFNLNSPFSRKKIEELKSGTTRKRISRKNLGKITFPLAPLPEQRVIVAKIEKLFSSIDNGVENLKAAKDKLEIYRQAVLKKAFEGGFTISHKWKQKKLIDIIKISSGNGLTKAERNDEGKYLVYGGNGVTGRHDDFMFEDKQLIIGRVGVHCGNTHITEAKCWVTDNAFIVTFDKGEISLKCLYYLILSLRLNQYANSTAQPVISGSKVYPVKFFYPPKEIQENIVQEIETRLSVCDNILETIEEALEKSEALRQSILKKAFEGKLLNESELKACRKEADWEPADKLLERIKKEKKAGHGK